MFWVSRHLNHTANLNITILGSIYDCKLMGFITGENNYKVFDGLITVMCTYQLGTTGKKKHSNYCEKKWCYSTSVLRVCLCVYKIMLLTYCCMTVLHAYVLASAIAVLIA